MTKVTITTPANLEATQGKDDWDPPELAKEADKIKTEFATSRASFASEAQARYDAAIEFASKQSGFPRFDIMWYHPDTVRQIARIASGLDPIPPQTVNQ